MSFGFVLVRVRVRVRVRVSLHRPYDASDDLKLLYVFTHTDPGLLLREGGEWGAGAEAAVVVVDEVGRMPF